MAGAPTLEVWGSEGGRVEFESSRRCTFEIGAYQPRCSDTHYYSSLQPTHRLSTVTIDGDRTRRSSSGRVRMKFSDSAARLEHYSTEHPAIDETSTRPVGNKVIIIEGRSII